GRYFEVEAEKFLTAGDVLKRLARGAPIDHRPEFRQNTFGQLLVEIDDQIGPVKASRFGQQRLRVRQVVGRGRGSQTFSGLFERLGDSRAHFPALFSRGSHRLNLEKPKRHTPY